MPNGQNRVAVFLVKILLNVDFVDEINVGLGLRTSLRSWKRRCGVGLQRGRWPQPTVGPIWNRSHGGQFKFLDKSQRGFGGGPNVLISRNGCVGRGDCPQFRHAAVAFGRLLASCFFHEESAAFFAG
jgi:hypothetical protein